MHWWRRLAPGQRNLLIGLGLGALVLAVGVAALSGDGGPSERLVAGAPTTSRAPGTTTGLPPADAGARPPAALGQPAEGGLSTTSTVAGAAGATDGSGTAAGGAAGTGGEAAPGQVSGDGGGRDGAGGGVSVSGIGASRGVRVGRALMPGTTGEDEGGEEEEGGGAVTPEPDSSTTTTSTVPETTSTSTTTTTVPEADLTLKLTDNGGEFPIAKGDTLAIELDPDPTGSWSDPTSDSSVLHRTSTNQNNGKARAVFTAAAVGTAHVEAKTPSVTFRVTINVIG